MKQTRGFQILTNKYSRTCQELRLEAEKNEDAISADEYTTNDWIASPPSISQSANTSDGKNDIWYWIAAKYLTRFLTNHTHDVIMTWPGAAIDWTSKIAWKYCERHIYLTLEHVVWSPYVIVDQNLKALYPASHPANQLVWFCLGCSSTYFEGGYMVLPHPFTWCYTLFFVGVLSTALNPAVFIRGFNIIASTLTHETRPFLPLHKWLSFGIFDFQRVYYIYIHPILYVMSKHMILGKTWISIKDANLT